MNGEPETWTPPSALALALEAAEQVSGAFLYVTRHTRLERGHLITEMDPAERQVFLSTQQAVQRTLAEDGWTHLADGRFRRSYHHPAQRVVLKLGPPHLNRSETARSAAAGTHPSPAPLMPVLHCSPGGSLLAMVRAERLLRHDRRAGALRAADAHTIRQRLAHDVRGLHLPGLSGLRDLHDANIGLWRDRWTVLDYAEHGDRERGGPSGRIR